MDEAGSGSRDLRVQVGPGEAAAAQAARLSGTGIGAIKT
jgi:hypothetical protein